MPTQQIPDKLYFRIGEVAAIVGVKSHVLRYWEEEFPSLGGGPPPPPPPPKKAPHKTLNIRNHKTSYLISAFYL